METYLITAALICLFIIYVAAQEQYERSLDFGNMNKPFLKPLGDIRSIRRQKDFVLLRNDTIPRNHKTDFANSQAIIPIPIGENRKSITLPLIPYFVLETLQLGTSYKNEIGLRDIELNFNV